MIEILFRKNIKYIIIRISIVSFFAICQLYVLQLSMWPTPLPLNFWTIALVGIIGFNIANELNLLLNKYLDKTMPWNIWGRKRIIRQTFLTFLLTAFLIIIITALWLLYFSYFDRKILQPSLIGFMLSTFLNGSIFIIMFGAIYIGIFFLERWKDSILDIEKLKHEKLKSDYRILQNQLNPHFLFNSFNVLISEISFSPQRAIEFTRRLSQVYRYVLQNKNNDLVTLREELNCVDAYIYVHKVRVENALFVDINVNELSLEKYLPPLTIQLLIENAIKHNIVSVENPLRISIESFNEYSLKVINNLQVKDVINSTQTGFENINARYSLIGNANIIFEKNVNEFSVTVPLFDK